MAERVFAVGERQDGPPARLVVELLDRDRDGIIEPRRSRRLERVDDRLDLAAVGRERTEGVDFGPERDDGDPRTLGQLLQERVDRTLQAADPIFFLHAQAAVDHQHHGGRDRLGRERSPKVDDVHGASFLGHSEVVSPRVEEKRAVRPFHLELDRDPWKRCSLAPVTMTFTSPVPARVAAGGLESAPSRRQGPRAHGNRARLSTHMGFAQPRSAAGAHDRSRKRGWPCAGKEVPATSGKPAPAIVGPAAIVLLAVDQR